MQRKSFVRGAFFAALVLVVRAAAGAGPNTNNFNFSGPEIFPIDQQISQLHVADMDGDGLNDLVVADNLRSQIDILHNLTGQTNPPARPLRQWGINDLPPGSRFRIDTIPVDENISAMVVKDLNGDGRPDIAYYGDANNLVVLYNKGTNGWSEPKRWHVGDGQLNPNALAAGDLNGAGRTDLVLLGGNGSAYFWAQGADHTLAEPVKIPYSGTPKSVQIVDVNGDGRSDLLFVDWDSSTPFRFRLQNAQGKLGPEIFFKYRPIRSFLCDNLSGNSNNYVVTIAQASGRAEVSRFESKPAEVLSGALRQGQFQVLPLTPTDAAQRGVCWADVNGDGRPDLLVADPETGQITVYLQAADGSLEPPTTYPTLAGVSQIAVADWKGDGRPVIFGLSHDEGLVGMTHFDKQGHLPFPTPIPLDGTPLVMTVGVLKHGAKPSLAVIVDKNGQRSLVICSADGTMKTQKLASSFTSNPVSLSIQDANQDGRPDLIVLIPYEKVKVLLQQADGEFKETDVDPPGGAMDQPWLTAVDVDGDGKPELLFPQKNFVRAVVLERAAKIPGSTNDPGWTFRVKDQINGSDSNSRIIGATVVKNGTNASPSIFLLDAGNNQLTLCERDAAGVWQVRHNMALPVSGFTGLQSVVLGGTNTPSIVFPGLNKIAWLPLAGRVWTIEDLAGYDTPIEGGYLNDVVAGDLNDDGRKELVFLETARNYLDIVQFGRDHKLTPAARWQVFEQHTFRSADNAIPEPREAAVADVTGDKKNDLIVVVHDRILVYPQD